MKQQEHCVIFTTPEQIIKQRFLEAIEVNKDNITRFVIDEMHCITHW